MRKLIYNHSHACLGFESWTISRNLPVMDDKSWEDAMEVFGTFKWSYESRMFGVSEWEEVMLLMDLFRTTPSFSKKAL